MEHHALIPRRANANLSKLFKSLKLVSPSHVSSLPPWFFLLASLLSVFIINFFIIKIIYFSCPKQLSLSLKQSFYLEWLVHG